MEFVLVVAVIVVLCLILGVSTELMMLGAAAIVGLFIAAMVLFFVYFFIRLLLSKKTKAEFSRVDKSPKSRFKVAYYMIDGKEYPNIFPAEGFMFFKFYEGEKTHTVFINRRKTFVFDKYTCATCIIGFIFSAVVIAASVWAYLTFIREV